MLVLPVVWYMSRLFTKNWRTIYLRRRRGTPILPFVLCRERHPPGWSQFTLYVCSFARWCPVTLFLSYLPTSGPSNGSFPSESHPGAPTPPHTVGPGPISVLRLTKAVFLARALSGQLVLVKPETPIVRANICKERDNGCKVRLYCS